MEMLTSRLMCRNRLQTGATFQAVSPSRGRAQNLALLYVHPEAVPRTSPCCTSIPRPCPEPRLAVRPSRGRAQNLALLYVHPEAVPRTSPCCTSITRLCPEPRLAVRPSRGRAQNLALLYVHHEAVPRTSPCCESPNRRLDATFPDGEATKY